MRYDDWDVILFPKDACVPIPEFKTACFVSPDEYGRQLPHLTCYIRSLPPATPFRISVCSWTQTAKASALIESLRRPGERVVYTIQLVVDGAMVFRGICELATKWPQEITHEKRTFASTEQPSSQPKSCLAFPPFYTPTLLQSSWNTRDSNGRIKLLLSEQLISKTNIPGEPAFGATNDIVCFLFQHAPNDVLEQAGISWPIRNPLYLPDRQNHSSRQALASPSTSASLNKGYRTTDVRVQAPSSLSSKTKSFQYHGHESQHQIPTQPLSISRASNSSSTTRNNDRTVTEDDVFVPMAKRGDNTSPGAIARNPSRPNSTSNSAKLDCLYVASQSRKPGSRPFNVVMSSELNTRANRNRERSRAYDRSTITTLPEDQPGQYFEAASPPTKHRKPPHGMESQVQGHGNHSHDDLQQGLMQLNPSTNTHLSSHFSFNTGLPHPSKIPMLDRRSANDPFGNQPQVLHYPFVGNKENRSPSQFRLPTPFPQANRVPTPHPFAPMPPIFSTDASMAEPSPMLAKTPRIHHNGTPVMHANESQAHSFQNSLAMGNVKSRKEGMMRPSPKLSDQRMNQDKCLPPLGNYITPKDQNSYKKLPLSRIPPLVEIIDLDGADAVLSASTFTPKNQINNTLSSINPPNPTHKPGMSSIDSTTQIEQNLFNALGEELRSFDAQLNATHREQEVAQSLGELSDPTMLDTIAVKYVPAGKRKRASTIELSPTQKKASGEMGGEKENVDSGRRLTGGMMGVD